MGISGLQKAFGVAFFLALSGSTASSTEELTGRTDTFRLFHSGYFVSTFGGNPIVFQGSNAFVTVWENGIDLNGDQDGTNTSLLWFNAETGLLRNLQVASLELAASPDGRYLGFTIDEHGQRRTDLNGDSDLYDYVLHVLDLSSGQISNLGIAAFSLGFAGNDLVFLGSEYRQSADLNGDGDMRDLVFHAYNHDLQSVTNSALAVVNLAATSEHGALFTVAEAPGNDLNSDGDDVDPRVLHVYDSALGSVLNLGVTTTDTFPGLTSSSTHVAFVVDEGEQGQDLDGDGYTLPFVEVLHIYDWQTRTVTNLTHWVTDNYRDNLLIQGNFLQFKLLERHDDLNGDGDTNDHVLHLYDFRNAQLTNLQISARPNDLLPVTTTGVVMYTRSELIEGLDLNNDGDLLDHFGYAYDSTTETTLPLGHWPRSAVAGENSFVYQVWEKFAEQDLNGDGDQRDRVFQFYDAATGEVRNLGFVAGGSRYLGNKRTVSLSVHEQTEDLNGDGDLSDVVLQLYDVENGEVSNLGFATRRDRVFSETKEDFLAFNVVERSEGESDLNRDGDFEDEIGHLVYLGGLPCGVGSANAATGPVEPTLFLNGSPSSTTLSIGSTVELKLIPPLAGPFLARYTLWAWPSAPQNPTDLSSNGGSVLGCTMFPTPIDPTLMPQPTVCLRSPEIPAAACVGTRELPAPTRAPWTLRRVAAKQASFVLQGIIQDNGSPHPGRFSVTNAIELRVE